MSVEMRTDIGFLLQQELGLRIGLRVHGNEGALLSPTEATQRQNSTHGLSGNYGGESEESEENKLCVRHARNLQRRPLIWFHTYHSRWHH